MVSFAVYEQMFVNKRVVQTCVRDVSKHEAPFLSYEVLGALCVCVCVCVLCVCVLCVRVCVISVAAGVLLSLKASRSKLYILGTIIRVDLVH